MTFRRTQLFEMHQQTAKLTEFAGFEMPLYYKGIVPEHLAVRNSVGMFDISHMGRVMVTGADSESFMNYVITNDVARLTPSAALYSVMCTSDGGIIDDFVVYRLETERFLVVFNANNRRKDYDWLVQNAKAFNVSVEDLSDSVAMLAVQGPRAYALLQELSKEDLSKIERFKCGHTKLANVDVFLSRTGYTGEDGFEVFIWNTSIEQPDNSTRLWRTILEAGKSFGVEPCGLGARDTLRLEAGLCLYGNDIDESTSPLEAGLGFVVKLQKERFVGKEALQKQKIEGIERKRVGIIVTQQGIPRAGFEIRDGEEHVIGRLTSGTFSPLLKRGIGMGYVEASKAQEGAMVNIRVRDKQIEAKIASFPLYDPDKYGYKRKILP